MKIHIYLVACLCLCFNVAYAQLDKPTLSGRVLINGEMFASQRDIYSDYLHFADVRIGIRGSVEDDWYYKIDVGYASNEVSIKDILVGYRKESHQIQVGQFYKPYSLGVLISSTNMTIQQTASSVSTFASSRKLGASYTYDEPKFNVTVGAFTNNSTSLSNSGFAEYSIDARFIYRPIYSESRLLHIAFAPSWSKLDEVKSFAPSGISPDVIDGVVVDNANSQFKCGLEAYTSIDRFAFQAEYVATNVLREGADSYFAHGGYAEFAYALIGDPMSYDSRGGCLGGASGKSLRLVARYNYLNLNDSSSQLYGGSYRDIAIGVNYYIIKNIAAKLSYNHLFPIGGVGNMGRECLSTIQVRLQFSI